jgi:hypothetical protein
MFSFSHLSIPRLGALMITALGLTLNSACTQGNLPDYIRLGDLRILALQADHPEVDPATVVTLTPVVSDLTLGRTLSYSAEACVDPGVALGASPTCAGNPTQVTLSAGAIPTVGATKRTFTGKAPVITVTVPPATVIFANRSAMDQFNGVAYLVIYRLTAADGTAVTAIKRIIASTRPVKNSNPTLSDVTAGSTSLSAYLTALQFTGTAPTQVTLSPVIASGSAENYPVKTATDTITQSEVPITTWFLSDGDIQDFRTQNTDGNGWTPPATQPSSLGGGATAATVRGVVFVVVTRDGRGGEDFKQFEF